MKSDSSKTTVRHYLKSINGPVFTSVVSSPIALFIVFAVSNRIQLPPIGRQDFKLFSALQILLLCLAWLLCLLKIEPLRIKNRTMVYLCNAVIVLTIIAQSSISQNPILLFPAVIVAMSLLYVGTPNLKWDQTRKDEIRLFLANAQTRNFSLLFPICTGLFVFLSGFYWSKSAASQSNATVELLQTVFISSFAIQIASIQLAKSLLGSPKGVMLLTALQFMFAIAVSAPVFILSEPLFFIPAIIAWLAIAVTKSTPKNPEISSTTANHITELTAPRPTSIEHAELPKNP